MKYYLAILTSLGSLTAATAQVHARFTPPLKEAFGQVVELRFKEAHKTIEKQQRLDPQNRVPQYLEAAMLCIGLFVNEDQQHYETQKEQLDDLMDQIEDLPGEEPYRNLFLGELYVAQAILNGKFKNNFTAAWQFYKAYDYLTQNYRQHPDFKPTYIPLGVLNAAIGSLPEDYRSLASLLGFEGSVARGMALLSGAYSELSSDPNTQFYNSYAGFVYSFVSFQLDPGSSVSPHSLGLPVGSSSFLIYLQARIELAKGRPHAAAKWLDQRPRGDRYQVFHYLNYLQGKVLLGLEPDEAARYFWLYIRQSKNELYLKSSYRYLSWYYLIKGQDNKAEEMREQVFRQGSDHAGADRQALREARLPMNEVLIEARVLYDAARSNEAAALLRDNPVLECCAAYWEQVEYHYRSGRIAQRLHKNKEAQIAFQAALAVNQAEASYALGNSALQLGLLMEEDGQVSKAQHYFKRALQVKNFPFYEGVHQKAKAGLSRLRH